MNGYNQYKEQSIMTMTQAELLITLYDELIKRLVHANYAIDQKDYSLLEQSIGRAVDILKYLKNTLDNSYPISDELSKLYEFFVYELMRVKSGRKKEVLDEIIPLIKDLRNTFDEAGRRL